MWFLGQEHRHILWTCSKCKILASTPGLLSQPMWVGSAMCCQQPSRWFCCWSLRTTVCSISWPGARGVNLRDLRCAWGSDWGCKSWIPRGPFTKLALPPGQFGFMNAHFITIQWESCLKSLGTLPVCASEAHGLAGLRSLEINNLPPGLARHPQG